MRSYISILGALSAIGVLGVSAQDMPADLACVVSVASYGAYATMQCSLG